MSPSCLLMMNLNLMDRSVKGSTVNFNNLYYTAHKVFSTCRQAAQQFLPAVEKIYVRWFCILLLLLRQKPQYIISITTENITVKRKYTVGPVIGCVDKNSELWLSHYFGFCKWMNIYIYIVTICLSLPNITNKEICTNNKSQWT
jgi:hypothetical protein